MTAPEMRGAMSNRTDFEFTIGLSDEEKRDLEKMIGDFQKEKTINPQQTDLASIQKQIEVINRRLAYLTTMFLNIDRRMKPLFETVRLTFEKSEILNQRINAIINSLRSGGSL